MGIPAHSVQLEAGLTDMVSLHRRLPSQIIKGEVEFIP
jgi:hypothetical protein